MYLLNKLNKYLQQRVNKFGAQYFTFAIFGIINYPVALAYEIFIDHNTNSITLRLVALSLCFILLVKNHWPEKFKKYLPLFWYLTIVISLPIMTTFLLLKNNLSLGWLINFNIGVMIVILLLDSITFLVIELIGISIGTCLFFLLGNTITYQVNADHLSLFIYIFLSVVIYGTVFSRNKEIFNHFAQKAKDDLNESLEKKVQKRTLELKEALAAKTEFLNNMSHEIRTPIQGFTTLSKGLVDHWYNFDEKKKIKLAKTVASNAERLASLTTNLLDLSKFTANKMLLNLKQINLTALTETIITECEELYIHDKNIKIECIKPKQAMLMADEEKITQVLRNLFVNAIKFSPDNSLIKATITLSDNNCCFVLVDQAVGVPENELETIFESFTQSSRTKTNAGGTGLGLSICKKIIDAHHGKLWAENNIDSGASFYFTIPTKASL